MGKVLSFEEHERGFDPGIGHEEIAVELRQGASIFGYVCLHYLIYRPNGEAQVTFPHLLHHSQRS